MRIDLGSGSWGTVKEDIDVRPDGSLDYVFADDNQAEDTYRDRRRNDGSNGFGASREFREIGWLSPAEGLLLAKMWGVPLLSKQFDAMYMKMLNDRDFYRLKSAEGRVPNAMVKPVWL